MISFDESRIFIYTKSVDMRKGIDGFVLIYKRIENGRFKIQFNEGQETPLELSHEQLRWLMAGLDYTKNTIFPELKIKDFY